jgi:hypothetical protein
LSHLVTYLVLEYSHDIFFGLGNYSCSIRNTVLFYTCFFAIMTPFGNNASHDMKRMIGKGI